MEVGCQLRRVADGRDVWCSERCRREVWKWRRQEGMKRDALMLMKAIEASWPTAYAAEVIAELARA